MAAEKSAVELAMSAFDAAWIKRANAMLAKQAASLAIDDANSRYAIASNAESEAHDAVFVAREKLSSALASAIADVTAKDPG